MRESTHVLPAKPMRARFTSREFRAATFGRVRPVESLSLIEVRCPFSAASFLGHRFGIIPAPGAIASSAFSVPPLTIGSLPECSRSSWEQYPLAFWCPKKMGQKKEKETCRTYMLSGIASGVVCSPAL